MDYILFNADGSIQTQSMKRYIQQGSTGVDKFFVGYDSAIYESDICQAVFTLPNQSTNTLLGTFKENYPYEADDPENPGSDYDGSYCSGWVFTLTQQQTRYDGILITAIRIIRTNSILVDYPFVIIINKTGVRPETDTGVTISELDSYLRYTQSLNSYYKKKIPSKEFVYINDSLVSTKTGIYFKKPTQLMLTNKKPKRSKGQYINNGYGSKFCNRVYLYDRSNPTEGLFEGRYTFIEFLEKSINTGSEDDLEFELFQTNNVELARKLFPIPFRVRSSAQSPSPTITLVRTTVWIDKTISSLDEELGRLVFDATEGRRWRISLSRIDHLTKLCNAKTMIKFVENFGYDSDGHWTGNMCKNWLELQMAVVHDAEQDTADEYAIQIYYYPVARRFKAYQFTGVGTNPAGIPTGY